MFSHIVSIKTRTLEKYSMRWSKHSTEPRPKHVTKGINNPVASRLRNCKYGTKTGCGLCAAALQAFVCFWYRVASCYLAQDGRAALECVGYRALNSLVAMFVKHVGNHSRGLHYPVQTTPSPRRIVHRMPIVVLLALLLYAQRVLWTQDVHLQGRVCCFLSCVS